MTLQKKPRILLMHCKSDYNMISPQRWGYPLGLAYIASSLEEYTPAQVKIVDEVCRAGSDLQCESVLRAEDYDLVGFTVYQENLSACLRLAFLSKKIKPKALTVFGGPHASLNAESILQDNKQVDMIVFGEGELAMRQVILSLTERDNFKDIPGTITRRNGGIKRVPLNVEVDLDSLPFPSWKVVSSSLAATGILDVCTSRGCPFSCKFCCNEAIYKGAFRRWRARSTENVLAEIESAVGQSVVKHVRFTDANFLVRPDRAISIAKRLRAKFPGLTFSFSARADLIVKCAEIIHTLANCGCTYIEVGLENGSQKMLDYLGKGLSIRDNLLAIQILRKANILILPDYIMWLPDASMSDIVVAYEFLEDNYLIVPQRVYTKLTPYPGTRIHRDLQLAGRLIESNGQVKFTFAYRDTESAYERVWSFRQQVYESFSKLYMIVREIAHFDDNPKVRAEACLEAYAIQSVHFRFLSDLILKSRSLYTTTIGAKKEIAKRKETVANLVDNCSRSSIKGDEYALCSV